MRHILLVLMAFFLAAGGPAQAARQTILGGSGVVWGDEKAKLNSNFVEIYGWVNQDVRSTANPAWPSIHATTGNLAASNTQVTKKWITGLSYTANLTSVVYGGKHYICTSTHTAGSTTEPGVGADWATVWTVGVMGPNTIYARDTEPAGGNDGDIWVDTNGTTGQRLYTREESTWVAQAGGSGGTIADETFNATNFNGDTTSGVSQDDFYDRMHLFDTDDDGDYTDESWFPSTSGAPTNATYVTLTTEAGLSAEGNLGALTTGLVKNTVTAGVSVLSTAAAGTDFQAPLTNPVVQANLGTGVYTFLGTPTASNFFTAVTGEGAFAATLFGYPDAATTFSGIKQAATESATGVVELATTTEATTGTDTARAVTPAGVKAVTDQFWTQGTDGTYALLLGNNSASYTCSAGVYGINSIAGALYYCHNGTNTALATGGVPTAITVADTTDTASYIGIFESATGDLGPKTDAGLTYNAGTGMLTATGFTGPLTGTASGNLVSGGAAGTPSSITLTNGTGLPLSGVVDSTSEALGAGTIELGASSDTTLARSGAGAVTVEGVQVVLSGGSIGAGTATTPSANDNDTSVATTAFTLAETRRKYIPGSEADFYGTILDPQATYAVDATNHAVTIANNVPAAFTITEISVSCDADPTTEITMTFQHKTASIGYGTPTTIEAVTTTAGVATITTGFDDATIPAGTKVFMTLSDPDDALNECAWQIEGDWD